MSLGAGSNPQLTRDGKVALIRGRLFGYGDPFDCGQKDRKNWIAIYDPAARSESVLFDRALSFGLKGMEFCIFQQMQLSPDNSILYLVSPAYATAGSLAIVKIASGSVSYLRGVNSVFVIEKGPHQGELIYERRLLLPMQEPGGRGVYYPYVHARPDGSQIKVIGEESSNEMSGVRTYLRKIGAQIRVHGILIPWPDAGQTSGGEQASRKSIFSCQQIHLLTRPRAGGLRRSLTHLSMQPISS